MSVKAFMIGGLVGFGFGMYHGYNYAAEECNKRLQSNNVQYEQKAAYQPNLNGLDEILTDKDMYIIRKVRKTNMEVLKRT